MGSGSAGAMITSLKNNKNMLSLKRNRTALSDYERKPTVFKVEKAPPKLLRQIRSRIKNEEREKDFILWLLLTIIMVVLISVFVYFF